MHICKHCGEEFNTSQQLGGHVRATHGDKTDQDGKPKDPEDTHCPVCNYKCPFTDAWKLYGVTVCPKCVSVFDKHTKEIISEHGENMRRMRLRLGL